jgi:hypothetical protein
MPVARLLVLCLLLLAGFAHAAFVSAPIVADGKAAQAAFTKSKAEGRCWATDIFHPLKGTLFTGASEGVLPAGRYRLHVPLSMAPLGDLNVSAIAITVSAGDARRTLGMLNFAMPDEFTDITLDFTAPGGAVAPIGVSWALDSERAKKNKTAATTPEVPLDPEDEDDAPLELEPPRPDADGMVPMRELSRFRARLAATGVTIERLAPLTVEVRTPKVVYRTKDAAMASVTVRNVSDVPQTVTLQVAAVGGAATVHPVHAEPLTIPPRESTTWTGPVPLAGLYWGAELRATVKTADGREATGSAVFGVADNIWETALMAPITMTDSFADAANAEQRVRQMRAEGFTGFEAFFWAPDDFGDFTPDTENYLSGQTLYRESVSGTKNLIRAAHAQGLCATTYANLWGSDGASGFELMRKHPEWIANADFASDWLENWGLMEEGKVRFELWALTSFKQDDTTLPAMQVHADELIRSHRIFGWDAIRYDSYYSTPWTKAATALTRQGVEAAVPGYQFGYNSFADQDEKAGALDVMVGGGGLVMEESARSIAKNPASIAGYEGRLAALRDIVWPHNGHFGLCYDVSQKMPLACDEVYLSSIALACGAHPYYGRLEEPLGHHMTFALRYAEFLYHNRMRPLKQPAGVVAFGGAPALLDWTRLARRVDLGGDAHRLVLHLIPTPAIDLSMTNAALKVPTPLRTLPITLTLPADARVTAAWNLCPIAAEPCTALPWKGGATVTLTVPEVRFWNAIVIDYTAKEGVQ